MGTLAKGEARTAPTLRGRLTYTVLLTILLVLGGSMLLLRGVAAAYEARSTQIRAAGRLGEFDSFLSMRADQLVLQARNFSEWDEFYSFSAESTVPPAEWLSSELADWLPSRSDIRTMLWTGADGEPIWSAGDEDDVAALLTIARSLEGTAIASTRVAFENGPALAVVVPVTGFPLKNPAGHFAITEPIGTLMAGDFATLSRVSDVSVAALPRPDDHNTARDATSSGFANVSTAMEHGSLHVSADMIGWSDARIGRVSIEDPGAESSGPPYAPLLVALGALGLALAAALLVSLTTTHFVRRPVDRLVDYVSDVGMRAVEGAPYVPIGIDERAPAELRSMMEVVDGLTERLAERQSDLRSALAQAEELEKWFRITVDESSEGKVLFIDGTVRVANPAAVLQMGVPVERIIGMPLEAGMGGRRLKLAGSDESLTLPQIVERSTSLGRPVTVSLDTRERGTRWVEIAASVRPDSNAVLVSSRDVTEERRREELRAEILDMVSHDLKSPLSVISGYVDILERRPEDEGVVAKAIAGTREGVTRMLELLDDLLASTKADDLLAPRSLALVRLDRLAVQVADTLRPVMRQDIAVDVRCAASVRGEERRLRQVLTNLIGNAAKYSPERSVITVSITCAEDATVLLCVEDEGPGIPPGERERVFERFVRLGDDASGGGLGLGLYIVRAIVHGHGGSVRVEDRESGAGARFVVRLPAAGEGAD